MAEPKQKSVSLEDAVMAHFPSDTHENAKFVPASSPSPVFIHTDNPERMTTDGVYVLKQKSNGDLGFVLVGTVSGRKPLSVPKNDYSQPNFAQKAREASAKGK